MNHSMRTTSIITKHNAALLASAVLLLLPGCASRKSGLRTPDGRPMSEDYLRGRSDGIKGIYRNLQDQQRTKPPEESFGRQEVLIPEHWEDGVLMKPSRRVLLTQQ